MSGRVIHTGQVVIDLALRLNEFPSIGGDVFAEEAGRHVGGGYNVLYAARQLGAPTVYAGSLGSGPFSDAARDVLAEIGVEHVGATLDEGDLGYCIAITDATAERTFISTRGAETRNPPDAFDELTFSADDVLYVSGYSFAHRENAKALRTLIRRLTAPLPRCVVDVSPMVDSVWDEMLVCLRPIAPLWSVNEREAAIIAAQLGLATGVPEELVAGLAAELGEVVLRAGSDGAWYCASGERACHVPTLKVHAIDTNGAGDAHSGVLCAALAGSEPLKAALTLANAAGALSTTRWGPATCPDGDEVRAAAERLR